MNVIETMCFQGVNLDVYGTPKEPLFLAVDVAKIIDYGNGHATHMLEVVDENEKFLLNTRNNGASNARGNPQKWFLTESGLYEVLMQSRKPFAKRFKTVVKRMLMDLRHNGGYSMGQWFGRFEGVEDLDGFNDLRSDFGLPAVTDEEAFGKPQERWYERESVEQ